MGWTTNNGCRDGPKRWVCEGCGHTSVIGWESTVNIIGLMSPGTEGGGTVGLPQSDQTWYATRVAMPGWYTRCASTVKHHACVDVGVWGLPGGRVDGRAHAIVASTSTTNATIVITTTTATITARQVRTGAIQEYCATVSAGIIYCIW